MQGKRYHKYSVYIKKEKLIMSLYLERAQVTSCTERDVYNNGITNTHESISEQLLALDTCISLTFFFLWSKNVSCIRCTNTFVSECIFLSYHRGQLHFQTVSCLSFFRLYPPFFSLHSFLFLQSYPSAQSLQVITLELSLCNYVEVIHFKSFTEGINICSHTHKKKEKKNLPS